MDILFVTVAMHPEKHGNSYKLGNHRKSEDVKLFFLKFVDTISTPTGMRDGQRGPTHYFDAKFKQIDQFSTRPETFRSSVEMIFSI